MVYPDIEKLCERALVRLDEGDPPVETFEWLYGEIGSIARARDDVPLSRTSAILFLSSHFYQAIFDDKVEDTYKERIDKENVLVNPDDYILFSILSDQDLLGFIEDGSLNKGAFARLLKQIRREEELELGRNIGSDRFADLVNKLSLHFENCYENEKEEMVKHEQYGLYRKIEDIKDEAGAEESDMVETSLDILMEVHREVQNFPQTINE